MNIRTKIELDNLNHNAVSHSDFDYLIPSFMSLIRFITYYLGVTPESICIPAKFYYNTRNKKQLQAQIHSRDPNIRILSDSMVLSPMITDNEVAILIYPNSSYIGTDISIIINLLSGQIEFDINKFNRRQIITIKSARKVISVTTNVPSAVSEEKYKNLLAIILDTEDNMIYEVEQTSELIKQDFFRKATIHSLQNTLTIIRKIIINYEDRFIPEYFLFDPISNRKFFREVDDKYTFKLFIAELRSLLKNTWYNLKRRTQ